MISTNFILYTFFGGIAAASDLIIFTIMFAIFKTPYVNFLSYTIGTLISFYLNAKYNFNVKRQLTKRYAKFLFISVIGATWSSWLIGILIDKLFFPASASKLLVMPIVLLYQYYLSKTLVYMK